MHWFISALIDDKIPEIPGCSDASVVVTTSGEWVEEEDTSIIVAARTVNRVVAAMISVEFVGFIHLNKDFSKCSGKIL